MRRFDDKEKAQTELTKQKQKVFKRFCPLLKTDCNNMCVCFERASLTTVARSNTPAPPVYEVQPKRCTNSMFSTEEE